MLFHNTTRIRKLCAKVKALVKKAAHAVYGVWKKIMSEKNKQAVKAKVSAMKQAVVHAAKSIKQKTVTKIKGLKTKETAEGLRTYKLFYISDYEKEASYLRDMSLKGYHFVRNDGFSFDFVKGEPKNYFYLLDYYKVDPSAEDLEKWQEQGWEDIFHAPVNYEGSCSQSGATLHLQQRISLGKRVYDAADWTQFRESVLGFKEINDLVFEKSE